jgi:ferredoxin-NADP reductase
MLQTLRIREVVPATARACIVRISPGGRSFSYRAGQALMVAAHEHDRRRPYSITTAPEDAQREDTLELLIGVDATGSPGSHLALEAGALVDVEGPVGQFTIPDDVDASRFVFIAGGTGIAPIRAMLRHALRQPRRHISVLYSARTPEDFAYDEELQRLACGGRIDLRRTVTRDLTSAAWLGMRGRIGRQDLAPLVEDPSTCCFICGPLSFVHHVRDLLDQLEHPERYVRTDAWTRCPAPATSAAGPEVNGCGRD